MTDANTRELRRPEQPRRVGLAVWGIGGALAGFVLASAILLLVALIGMAVIIGLGYDQTIGAPIYAGLFVLGIVGYALIVRTGIRLLGRSRPVPWIVWPALAAFPLAWAAFSMVSSVKGMISPAVSILAGLGLLLAWLSMRVDPVGPRPALIAGAESAGYAVPSSTMPESNAPER